MFVSQAAVVIANSHRYTEEHRAKDYLEALVNTVPVGVSVFDAKTGDLVSLNQESRRIVRGLRAPGRSQAEILSVLTFRRPDGREIPLAEMPTERALKSGETVRAEEIIIQLPDGQAVTTVVNATPIFSEEGAVVSVVATLQDMTPLEDLERLRAEFLGMVSHELRTPLTTIKGSAATLLTASSTLSSAEMGDFFRIIDEQTDHMRSLISDLLDVTRIEAGSLSVTPEPTVVAALVDQAREAFLRDGARNSIEVDLPPDLPRIGADRQRMMQVLTNLLSNASKNSSDQSAIRVSASVEDVYVAISVSDEGRGVSAERLPPPLPEVLPDRQRGPGPASSGRGPGPGHLQGNSGGARGPDTGRERGTGTRNAVHLHGSGGCRAVQRLGNRPRPAPRRLRTGAGGSGAHSRSRRRAADTPPRPEHAIGRRLHPHRDRRSG